MIHWIYQCDDIIVEPHTHRLERAHEDVSVEPKAYAVLVALLENAGEVVEKDLLLDIAWGHRHVTPGVLSRVISQLRHALGDSVGEPRYIATVHTLGYRFIGNVQRRQAIAETSVLSSAPIAAATSQELATMLDTRRARSATKRSRVWLVGWGAAVAALGLLMAMAHWHVARQNDDYAFDGDLHSAVLMHETRRGAEAHERLTQMQTDYRDQPAKLRRVYEADATFYMDEQLYAQAEQAFTRALQVSPDEPALLYGRGSAYADEGKIDQAVDDFRHLLALKPNDTDARNALGYTLADANRELPEAQRLIEAARLARPGDPAIEDSWAWLQYRLGHLDQAEQTLRSVWATNKDAAIGAHLGEVLWKQGRREDAQRVFNDVRKVDPQSTSVPNALKRLNP
ncbi:tetratricopeptide repeat protein [Dyella amyloliquefaciens]|uniref:tetratricopeptide repeat protein n=1 Tax=Dyella amyloliquefaciens TaxID=1770545 RepID=UPI0013EE81EB|nr:tetratricopeptide repeat protein [Dyella amyloliquefaciens]